MNYTEHYQLNQWENSDRVLREDFNSDNAKIDAALAGQVAALQAAVAQLRSENLCVKLVDVTTTAAAQQINVDVSQIDLTQYSRVDLCFQDSGDSNTSISLRVNGRTDYTSTPLNGSGSGYDSTVSHLAFWWVDGGVSSGVVVFSSPAPGALIHTVCSMSRSSSHNNIHLRSACTWDEVETLNFIGSSVIPAGTRIILTGVRK